jgi:hypothetical protein
MNNYIRKSNEYYDDLIEQLSCGCKFREEHHRWKNFRKENWQNTDLEVLQFVEKEYVRIIVSVLSTKQKYNFCYDWYRKFTTINYMAIIAVTDTKFTKSGTKESITYKKFSEHDLEERFKPSEYFDYLTQSFCLFNKKTGLKVFEETCDENYVSASDLIYKLYDIIEDIPLVKYNFNKLFDNGASYKGVYDINIQPYFKITRNK